MRLQSVAQRLDRVAIELQNLLARIVVGEAGFFADGSHAAPHFFHQAFRYIGPEPRPQETPKTCASLFSFVRPRQAHSLFGLEERRYAILCKASYSTPNASKTLPALPPHSPYPELT